MAAPSTGFYLTIATPNGASTTKKVNGDLVSVGRADDCSLTIPHQTLSRKHMSVSLKNGRCWIEDHGSSNGTFVNGKRVSPHAPIPVQPEDHVLLGQSGVKLSVSTEPVLRANGIPPLPPESQGMLNAEDTISSNTAAQRLLLREESVKKEVRTAEEMQLEAQRALQEALKKSADLLHQSQIEAEQRVQEIYRRAYEVQAKADGNYQKRLSEAYVDAEQVYQSARKESEEMILRARQGSLEIRRQAESFVMDLRRRTESDCESMIADAQVTARELKKNRLLEAEEEIRQKEATLLKEMKETAEQRLVRLNDDLEQEAKRQRARLEEEQRADLESLKKVKSEIESFGKEKEILQKKSADLMALIEGHSQKLVAIQSQAEQSSLFIEQQKGEAASIQSAIEKAKSEKAAVEDKLLETKNYLARAHEESRNLEKRKQALNAELESELLKLKEKFEEEKARLIKTEKLHIDNLKLATARKVAEYEKQLVEELAIKKDRIQRELTLIVETHLKNDGSRDMKQLQLEMGRVLNAQLSVMSNDLSAKTKQKDLVSLKRREKVRLSFVSLCAGALLCVGGFKAQEKFMRTDSPLQRKVAAAAEARKADLEKRKFNPPQSKEYQGTYVDNVIYTKDFTATYLNDDFQNYLMKRMTPYMMKTWRLSEEKVIQALASTSALVKGLAERKESIHPDFVDQGIERMREQENAAALNLRKVLGSAVRLDSFKKFEQKSFDEYLRGGDRQSPAKDM